MKLEEYLQKNKNYNLSKIVKLLEQDKNFLLFHFLSSQKQQNI